MTATQRTSRVLGLTLVALAGIGLQVTGQTHDAPLPEPAPTDARLTRPVKVASPQEPRPAAPTSAAPLPPAALPNGPYVNLIVSPDAVNAQWQTTAHLRAAREHANAVASLEQCQSCHGDGVQPHPVTLYFSSDDDTPWIGIAVAPVDDVLRAQLKLPSEGGVVVTQVVEGGPAAEAGLAEHDVLVSIDSHPLASGEGLDQLLKDVKPDGPPLKVRGIRAGEAFVKQVQPRRRTPAQNVSPSAPVYAPRLRIGISMADPDPTLRKQLKLGNGGAVVTAVEAGSAAAERGVQVNDVIIAANGVPITKPQELTEHVQRVTEAGAVELTIIRAGAYLNISVTPRKTEHPNQTTIRRIAMGATGTVDAQPHELYVVRPGVLSFTEKPDLAATEAPIDRLKRVTAEMERLSHELEALRRELAGEQEQKSATPDPMPTAPAPTPAPHK